MDEKAQAKPLAGTVPVEQPVPRQGASIAPAPGQAPAAKPATATLPAAKAKEAGGPKGPEPTRYGDWERKGICVDF